MREDIKGVLLAGIPFGATMGLISGLMSNFQVAVITGVFLGLVFGILINIFIKIQSKKFKKIRSVIVGDNDIIMEGAANHFMGKESVGGWLYLTKKEVIFKSHNVNIQKHQTIIPLNEVKSVESSLTLGFVPNGMKIITNREVERFVVHKRTEWVERITTAILSEYNPPVEKREK